MQGVTRPIAFEGDPAGRPTISARDLTSTAAGSVRRETDRPDDGEFAGLVKMDRRALVVLAASYHGRWEATVDGKPVATQMVAPSFVAVEVPPGTHTVAFRYAAYPATNYAVLFGVGILAIGSLAVLDRRTAPDVQRRCGDASGKRPMTPPTDRRAIVVAPHPDDEVLGASGILTSRPCTVVFATDGVPPDSPDGTLGDTRVAESRVAHEHLGARVDDIVRLQFTDQRVADVVKTSHARSAQ